MAGYWTLKLCHIFTHLWLIKYGRTLIPYCLLTYQITSGGSNCTVTVHKTPLHGYRRHRLLQLKLETQWIATRVVSIIVFFRAQHETRQTINGSTLPSVCYVVFIPALTQPLYHMDGNVLSLMEIERRGISDIIIFFRAHPFLTRSAPANNKQILEKEQVYATNKQDQYCVLTTFSFSRSVDW